jgi:hypothetical protein
MKKALIELFTFWIVWTVSALFIENFTTFGSLGKMLIFGSAMYFYSDIERRAFND